MNMLISNECLQRVDKAGKLNGERVAKALQTIKDFDTQGLTAPWTISNNRFPVARVRSAIAQKGIFGPVSDWIRLDRFN